MTEKQIATTLANFYDEEFGGKTRGRYRISMKHLLALAGRRRIRPRMLRSIAEELYELGHILIDLETYFVVLSQKTFVNYRRVSDSRIEGRRAQESLH